MDNAGKNYTILVVDDYPSNLRVLIDSLKDLGWKTLVARNGEGALRQAEIARPDIILLDVMMPGIDGFETCRRLKENEAFHHVPVIFMTALSDTINKVRGFEVGGVDYITKPFDSVELIARVKVHIELKYAREALQISNQNLQEINQKLIAYQKELIAYQQKLEIMARIDPLTRLSNRRDIIDRFNQEINRLSRNKNLLSILLCDIDHFKNINDTYGHDCGDYVLVTIANIIRSMSRTQDHVARWGGEEFLLILTETNIQGAHIFSERIREAIITYQFIYQNHQFFVTLTSGVSQYGLMSHDLDTCIKNADLALYEGKRKGRNQSVMFKTEML
ncbi:MAG: diguanylate cyclase [Desulfobacterales bacterium]|nr:diguanylate cyclase [Desulfobacterales bacterium]